MLLTRFFLLLTVSWTHTRTHTRAGSHGRRECEECSKPRADVLTRPRLHAVTTGSVARPPCARPTGSNTRPGQPSSSSRPIIKQQAVLQLTSLPPSPLWCRGLRRGRKYCLLLQLLAEDALIHYIGGGYWYWSHLTFNLHQQFKSFIFKSSKSAIWRAAQDPTCIITAIEALFTDIKVKWFSEQSMNLKQV